MDEAEEALRLHRATSVRLRRRRDQARKEFLNNRRSGDFGYKTSGVVDDEWDFQSFVQHTPSVVDRAGVFSDSELDPCQCGPRRPKHRHRPRPEEAARARGAGVRYTDFGFIDQQRDTGGGLRQDNRVEPVYEYLASRPAPPQRQPAHRVSRSQEISHQLLSLPVTISEFAQRQDNNQLLKGSLWLKRDKFFSKWRERFFAITSTFIKCFESEAESILLWKMEISEVGDIFMTDKKGYITLNVIFKKEGKIMLRSSSGIQKWFSLIKSLAGSHVGAHRQLGTKDFWSGKQQPQGPGGGGGHINNVDSWLLDRQFFDTKSNINASPPSRWYPGAGHSPSQPPHRAPHAAFPARQPEQPPPQFQSLHNLWQDTAAPVTRPPHRSSNRRMRPKSCIELSENNKHYKIQNLKSEDSGNSSMSTSTPRSSRK